MKLWRTLSPLHSHAAVDLTPDPSPKGEREETSPPTPLHPSASLRREGEETSLMPNLFTGLREDNFAGNLFYLDKLKFINVAYLRTVSAINADDVRFYVFHQI